MRFRSVFAVMAAVMAISAHAFAGEEMHQVTIDDVMRFRIITNVDLLPSGALLLRIQSWGNDTSFNRDLFIQDRDGQLRQLTFNGRFKGDYTVSPDGTNVVFVGERDGRRGLMLLPLTGGESRVLFEMPVGASALRWVGNKVYFSASVFPECGMDFACTRKKLDDRVQTTTAMTYTDLYMRPWNTWADGTKNNLFVFDMMTGMVDAVATGDFDVPTLPWGGVEDYSVSPDGKSLCYTAKKDAKKYRSTNDDLFEITGGKEKKITSNPASDRAPQYSPDGRYIAFLSQELPGYESDRIRLKVYDRKSGETVSLTDSLDDWVMDFVWAKDSGSLIATVAKEGRRALYRVSLNKREGCTPIFDRGMYRNLILASDGRTLFHTRDSLTTPPELYRMDIQTGASEKLTKLNDDILATLLLPEIEEIRWDGAEVSPGVHQRVHGFLARPVDATGKAIKKKVPLVLMIHGGPQGAWEQTMHPRWTPLGITGSGYAVAMPNPTGSFGYGQDFVVKVSTDWGGRAYQDLMSLVDYLAKDPAIDGTRVAAMGGSYGGYMANWMEAKAGTRFKCLISHAGPADIAIMYGTTDELWFPEFEMRGTPWEYPDEYRKWSPLTYVMDFKTPMLVMHGANDFRVPLEQALGMFTALKRRDIDAKLVVFPDEDHFIQTPKNRRYWYKTVNEWLDKYLKK